MALDRSQIDEFERTGFVALSGAIPADLVAACRADLAVALRAEGVDPDDRASWTRPVVRIPTPMTEPFRVAGRQPLLAAVSDDLLGAGAWHAHPGLGGTVPVRFPHPDDPGDAGWHVDGSYDGADGTYWVNVASRDRGLLMLVLFDDVSADDAPTELKVGSHLDVPRVLQRYGADGASIFRVVPQLPSSTYDHPSAFATGAAGDVFVCHPFLVHRATWPHRGQRPRAMAQPGVATVEPFRLDGVDPCPVERAILAGLDR